MKVDGRESVLRMVIRMSRIAETGLVAIVVVIAFLMGYLMMMR